MLRTGIDLDGIRPYIAGGVALAEQKVDAELALLVDGRTARFTSVDRVLHVGWKAAIGVDVNLGQKTRFFVQASYADFNAADYHVTGTGAYAGGISHIALAFSE